MTHCVSALSNAAILCWKMAKHLKWLEAILDQPENYSIPVTWNAAHDVGVGDGMIHNGSHVLTCFY